jgi:hypothetical protein
MMAVALVGAGEAIASRISLGDADVDEASELMINLFWRGLKGRPADSPETAESPQTADSPQTAETTGTGLDSDSAVAATS